MDKKPLIVKWLAIVIILLFVGVTIAPAIAQYTEKPLPASRGNWLYVGGSGPGNYTKIQDAIDNALEGDTVFVYDDSSPYIERVFITKTISLVGENRNTTEIDTPTTPLGTCVNIDADNTTVCNFTIKDRGVGLGISTRANNNCIKGNVFDRLESFSDCIVCYGNNNTISNNFFIAGAYTNIQITAERNIICNNYFGGGDITDGVVLYQGNHNVIKNNNFHFIQFGIYLQHSSCNNIIFGNTFISSYCDCRLSSSCNMNAIYHNNFSYIDSVFDYGEANNWQKGYPSGGNFWHDYQYEDKFSGVNQDEPGADGIGDHPVPIQGGNNSDYHPLMSPYGTTKLEIVNQKYFKPSMTIQNIGDTTAFLIQWNIIIKGRFIFSEKNSSGYAPKSLLGLKEIQLSTDSFLLGFGRTDVVFTAWAENAPIVTKKVNGFLLFFFFKPSEDFL